MFDLISVWCKFLLIILNSAMWMGEEDEVSQSIWTCPEGQGGGIAKEGKQQV